MEVGGIVSALVVGAVIGVLGRLVVPGRQRIGLLLTVGIGMVAALLGTAVANGVGVAASSGIDWIELVIQVVLAGVGVSAVAAFIGRR